MAVNTIDARIRVKRSILTGTTPTVARNDDFTDGTWLTTDTRAGEFFFNANDERLFIGNLTGFNEVQFVTTGSTTVNDIVVNEGIHIATGTNKTSGYAVLSTGSVEILTNKVTDNSLIFITQQSDDPGGTNGTLRVDSRIPGVSFTVRSTEATSIAPLAWMIIEPF